MNEPLCIVCYETLNHNNIYLLSCCKQSMCNICLNKLNKPTCPLCRKTINSETSISHSYTPQYINQINFNFNEMSYDDDRILLNFRERERERNKKHNRVTNNGTKQITPYSRTDSNSTNREIISQGLEEHKNDQNQEFSFDDQFN